MKDKTMISKVMTELAKRSVAKRKKDGTMAEHIKMMNEARIKKSSKI